MKYLISILIIIALISCQSNKQESVSANNSSNYALVHLDSVFEKLDEKVSETSGLMKLDSTIWSNNDSGGKPNLYNINLQSGEITNSVILKDVKNVDWEELTTDSTHFYVGNFGNNLGKRKNLMIHKGLKKDLSSKAEISVETIHFSYPDQDKFYDGYNHNHDCEAMIIYDNKIVLFSKNWLDRRCKMYELPLNAGTYEAKLVGEFNSDGVITAADISQDGSLLVLLGYTGSPKGGFDPFLWKIYDWKEEALLNGQKERINFHTRRQMEGIVFESDSTLIISSEAPRGGFASIYRLKI